MELKRRIGNDLKQNFKSISFWMIILFVLIYGIINVIARDDGETEHIFNMTGKGNECLASIPSGYLMYSIFVLAFLFKYYLDNIQLKKIEGIWAGYSRNNVYIVSLCSYIIQFTMIFIAYVTPSIFFVTYQKGYCDVFSMSEILLIIRVVLGSFLFIITLVSLLHSIMFCSNNVAILYLPVLIIGLMIMVVLSDIIYPTGTDINPEILKYSLVFIGREFAEMHLAMFEFSVLCMSLIIRVIFFNCIGLFFFNKKEIA